MKREFYTPSGTVVRNLTQAEVKRYAKDGDQEALRELYTVAMASATTNADKVTIIDKYIRRAL